MKPRTKNKSAYRLDGTERQTDRAADLFLDIGTDQLKATKESVSVPDIEPSGKLSFDIKKKLCGIKPGLIKEDNPPSIFLQFS